MWKPIEDKRKLRMFAGYIVCSQYPGSMEWTDFYYAWLRPGYPAEQGRAANWGLPVWSEKWPHPWEPTHYVEVRAPSAYPDYKHVPVVVPSDG